MRGLSDEVFSYRLYIGGYIMEQKPRRNRKKIIAITLLILILIFTGSGIALGWFTYQNLLNADIKLAHLEFNISNPKGIDKEYRIYVDDSDYVPVPDYYHYYFFAGDSAETSDIVMDLRDPPLEINITNNSNREAYVRLNIIPEWQTIRDYKPNAPLIPFIGPEPDMEQLFSKGFKIIPSPASNPGTGEWGLAYNQLNSGNVKVSNVIRNTIYEGGNDTGMTSLYVYLIDNSNKLAAVLPPYVNNQTPASLTFTLSLEDIKKETFIPIDAHSLVLYFNVESIQATADALAFASDPSNPGVNVPWTLNSVPTNYYTLPTRTPKPAP
jgi:flagellar basal body-associated protein FliL